VTPDELYAELVAGFPAWKFFAGLLVAFIDLFINIGVPGGGMKTLQDVLGKFPRQLTTSAGKHANTLILKTAMGTLSLRPFYNAAERYFRAEHKRFDYPSCAPHATQAWGDYVTWLDALATFTPKQIANLRVKVCRYVLDTLKSQEFDPASSIEPPLFRMAIENFDVTSRKGEPTGPDQALLSCSLAVQGCYSADRWHLVGRG
jgi:hypothetical protein